MTEFPLRVAAARDPLDFLGGGGEMGALVRALDWSATPLGALAGWPQSLRSAISILLPSKAQIVLFWGPEFITVYNDAYRPVFGAKYPWALGRPARECWSEVWDVLRPLFEDVVRSGEAFWARDHPFRLERHGYPEETYFDISYDPVRDESGDVGGVFCIVSETTGRVLGERRLRALQQVMWNLLSNAVRFTPANGRIQVRLERIGSQVAVAVTDTGCGIPADVLPHVSERFWQGDGSSSRRHGGLGLGLALVKHLVELHGGTVRVESPGPGGGTTFVLELPRMAPVASDPVRESAPARLLLPAASMTGRLERARLLVVDGEADTIDLFTKS